MPGAQGPSATLAAQILQRPGLITYGRGRLEIVDRDGLVGAACECYAIVTDDYERSMRVALA